jgi:hypothetical protein
MKVAIENSPFKNPWWDAFFIPLQDQLGLDLCPGAVSIELGERLRKNRDAEPLAPWGSGTDVSSTLGKQLEVAH